MRRKIGLLLVIIGFFIAALTGYQWWNMANAVTVDKELAQAVDEDWHDRNEQETLMYPIKEKVPQAEKKAIEAEPAEMTIVKETKPVQPDYEQGEEIGKLTIPKMGKIFPIYWGTDEATLAKGIGFYNSGFTVTPDRNGHTALAGHRDTVFVGLDQLKEGDRLYLEMEGIVYEYQIRKTWITHAEDRTVIVEKNEPTLTLTTCYPFDFIGSAPDRYIVQSELVSREQMK